MKNKKELEERLKYNKLACASAKKVLDNTKKEELLKTVDKDVLKWLMASVTWAMYEARVEECSWMLEERK